MPVTGNNITETVAKESILSIQLSLNGLSFCVRQFNGKPVVLRTVAFRNLGVASLPADEVVDYACWTDLLGQAINSFTELALPFARVQIVADTGRVTLMPSSIAATGNAALILSADGVMLASSDVIVVCTGSDDVVPAVVLPRNFKAFLDDLWPEAEYLHPLSANLLKPLLRPALELNVGSSAQVYVTLRDGALLFAEALPFQGATTELLYYISKLGTEYDLAKFDLLITGSHAGVLCDGVRQFYKRCTVDKKLLKSRKRFPGIDILAFNNLIYA